MHTCKISQLGSGKNPDWQDADHAVQAVNRSTLVYFNKDPCFNKPFHKYTKTNAAESILVDFGVLHIRPGQQYRYP